MHPTLLRTVMARVPGPVTVVTTLDPRGRSWGFTANSFTSVSLDPPLVLVCVGKAASTHAAFVAARHFLVNVLSQDQAEVARHFATSGIDRFAAGQMRPCELGLPGLADACARLACVTHQTFEAGDPKSEMLSGHASEEVGEAEAGRQRERHPEIDPDTRLGLHPTISSREQ